MVSNVAGFGSNVERNFVLSTKSKEIEHVQFVSTLSKGRNFTIESLDIVVVCGNKVECCFDKVERSFDNVAGVWTGLNLQSAPNVHYQMRRHKLFIARRYASAVYVVALCLYGCRKPVLYQTVNRRITRKLPHNNQGL